MNQGNRIGGIKILFYDTLYIILSFDYDSLQNITQLTMKYKCYYVFHIYGGKFRPVNLVVLLLRISIRYVTREAVSS
jgi:hypothetical protein